MTDPHTGFLETAVRLAAENIAAGAGGPFGAVVVRDGEIVGRGVNRVLATSDPTAHAEVLAIREAAAALRTPHLTSCTLYASSEPCPMCLASAMWARIPRIFHALSRTQATAMGFDDSAFYEQLSLPAADREVQVAHVPVPTAGALVQQWNASPHRRLY